MNVKFKGKMKSLRKHGLILLAFSITLLSAAYAKVLNLAIDGAQVIKFDTEVSEIFIANPEIADVQLSNKTTAYVFGKKSGSTNLFAMNAKGQEVLSLEIVVRYDLKKLKELVAAYDPRELVEIKGISGGIVLEGPVDSPQVAEDIRALAESFLKKSTANAESDAQFVINRLTIKPPVQVNLRVKIAEVARSVINRLGFDWQAAISKIGDVANGTFKFGALANRSPFTTTPILSNDVTSIEQATTTQPAANVSALGFGYRNADVNVNVAIDLLSRDGLITILAEPNLVAVSGETASFLAGGEFPYPVPQNFQTTTIQFNQYGVSLAFTPTVLDGNLISMRVRPEVSELDHQNSVVLFDATIPGILTRRAETTIQLGSGQTFAIAGLLKNTSASQIEALPGLGDLPILGALFRSNAFIRGDSELVILVTPYLVEPISGKEMNLPTDGLNFASFIEQIFERRLVKQTSQKGQAPVFGPGGVRLIGPAGFSIE